MELRLTSLVQWLMLLLSLLCLAPFTKAHNGALVLSRGKYCIFAVILTGVMYLEISNIIDYVISPPSDGETRPQDMMTMVITLRFAGLIVYLVGATVNAALLAPMHLQRCYSLCRQLDHTLPVSFQAWRLALFAVTALSVAFLEGWVYRTFRFRDGVAQGPLVQALVITVNSAYAHAVAYASDVIFFIACIVNHSYHQRIVEAIACGDLYKYQLFIRTFGQKQLGVTRLRELFGKACDLKASIQAAFKMQFLLTMAITFIDCTVSTYMSLQGANRHQESSKHIYLQVWCAILLAKILVITTLADSLNTDLEETAIEVHRRYNTSADTLSRSELLAFSQEIGHRKTPFTALNLFSIDYTIFPKIVGIISTHIIILMQFRIAREQKGEEGMDPDDGDPPQSPQPPII